MQNEITELRNQVRTLKRIVYGFGCLLVAGVIVSATSVQTVPDVIQAKKFEVVNDEGKTVVELATTKDGGVLSIRNNDVKTVATVGVDADGGVLDILSTDGKLAGLLSVDKDCGGVLHLRNIKGEITFNSLTQ